MSVQNQDIFTFFCLFKADYLRKEGKHVKKVGIVCEFNPMHNGHVYMLDRLRTEGARQILCVMSSYFVQRCEPACVPPAFRASCAASCGADAVFELPFPYSCASAEFFAQAGVYILSQLGCDTIAFGSECGDIDTLSGLADEEKVTAEKDKGSASGQRRLAPNDILAVEYIRAARRLKFNIDFYTVKREGTAHNSCFVSDNAAFPSSSAVRTQIKNGSVPEGLPLAMISEYSAAEKTGMAPVFDNLLGTALYTYWRCADPDENAVYAECAGGVSGRLHNAALSACSYAEMMQLAATKKYTDARLRRASLYAFLGVKEADLKTLPAYTRLLAMNENGREILKYLPSEAAVTVASKVRDIPGSDAAFRQSELEKKAESLYTAILPQPCKAGTLFSASARIKKNKD